MSRHQRWLIVVSLFGASILFATYSLRYQAHLVLEYGGHVYTAFPSSRLLMPVITLSIDPEEPEREGVKAILGPPPRMMRGLYPRDGFSVFEAALAGVVIPSVFAVVGCYLLVGLLRVTGQSEGTRKPVTEEATNSGEPTSSERQLWTVKSLHAAVSAYVLLAVAVFPWLLIMDLPSVLLVSRLRFPRIRPGIPTLSGMG